MNLKEARTIADELREHYLSEIKKKKESQRWLQDFRNEIEQIKQYKGREILELLQNADDAKSDTVHISLNTKAKELSIKNTGKKTAPFSVEGFKSLLYANLSPKKNKDLIGDKGLGFRSILNWANTVTIYSGDTKIGFDEKFGISLWNSIAKSSHDYKEFEIEARNAGRQVPLSILALPEITKLPEPLVHETEIIIRLKNGHIEQIENELEEYRSESLLFLPNLKSIEITIDDEVIATTSVEVKEEIQKGKTIRFSLNNEDWVVCKRRGDSSSTGKPFEVACAYCLKNIDRPSNTPIFNYFPTKITFPFPCILHATLELDSSRNSIITDDSYNRDLIIELSYAIKDIADYLKTVLPFPSWGPLSLMIPNNKYDDNEYCQLLFKSLEGLENNCREGYIPTLDGEYKDKNNYYYLNDKFFEFINRNDTPDCNPIFCDMRANDPPEHLKLNEQSASINEQIEKYANEIKSPKLLAEFVKIVHDYFDKDANHKNRITLKILRDPNGEVINDEAYFNTGNTIEDIPSFRKIKYVDKELATHLIDLFIGEKEIKGIEASRITVRNLQLITNVKSTDISDIKALLLPGQSDKGLARDEYESLLKCLFKLFLDSRENFNIGDRKECYLYNSNNEWCKASSLVLADKKFPGGLASLKLGKRYNKSLSAKYPKFLEEVADYVDAPLIQDFLLELGVNQYYISEKVNYGGDKEYIDSIEDDNISFEHCNREELSREANTTRIAIDETFEGLTLNNIIKLAMESGYNKIITSETNISYYYYTQKSETVSKSYAAYKLQKLPEVQRLKNYIIEGNQWLFNKPLEKLKFETYDKHDLGKLLSCLGAKDKLDDCTPEELYKIINDKADQIKNAHAPINGSGIKAFYNDIKKVLDSNNSGGLPNGQVLNMICELNGELVIRNSREIYYSDNKSLPEAIRRNIPILYISDRVGEQSICKHFGCKTFKDIDLKIIAEDTNQALTGQLSERIQKLKPYFLASICKDISINSATSVFTSYKNLVDKIKISIVNSLKYSSLDSSILPLEDGEIITDNNDHFRVCFSSINSLIVFEDEPDLCFRLSEATCLSLNRSTSDRANLDSFQSLFNSNDKQLESKAKELYDEDLWEKCTTIYGLPKEEDILFWKRVFKANDIAFDKKQFEKVGQAYLLTIPECRSDITTPQAYRKRVLEKLINIHNKYLGEYLTIEHSKLESDHSKHYKYLQNTQTFRSEKWLKDLVKENDMLLNLSADYDGILREKMSSLFHFIPEGVNYDAPEILEEYLEIDTAFISQEKESLLYFPGHLAELLDKHEAPAKANSGHSYSRPYFLIKEARLDKPKLHSKVNHNTTSSTSKRSHISDRRKKELGAEAERNVLNALSESKKYQVINKVSKTLNPQTGDDSKGYDLTYRMVGQENSLDRLLEIKSSDGKSFILTSNEYKVAKENIDRYDIALVIENEIKIIKSAFKDESKYLIEPNGYNITISTTDEIEESIQL